MKNLNLRGLPILVTAVLLSQGLYSQGQLSDYQQLTGRLQNLRNAYPSLVKLESIAKTRSEINIWAVTVGRGDTDNHPGIAVISGVDGRYVYGPEMVVRFAEKLLAASSDDSISRMLDSVSFYIIPNLSPDATGQYFAGIKYERQANSRPTDDDRDGRINEDPFEDLNGDDLITMVRVKDPSGEWTLHEQDPRVMVRAEKKEGQKGSYLLISEGTDNDNDRLFNEDGEGGIVFNRNMTFQFEHFKPGAGPIPVSEPESRGSLDYLYERWNVYAVFTIGPSDNLSTPMSYDKGKATAEIITGIQEGDAAVNTLVSNKYNALTGKKHHATVTTNKGGFMQWAYFHFGRFSFGTPAFFIPEIKAKKDTIQFGGSKEEKYHEEVNFLRWADSVLTDKYFVDWAPIEHPGFKGRQAEVGGLYPYAKINPPVYMIDSLVETHSRFILWLASIRPDIEVLNLTITSLGNQLYRVEMDVYNKGIMPAMSELGERTRWLKKPKIHLQLKEGQQILSGKKITLLDELKGDDKKHLSWLIQGSGTFTAAIGAPQTGIQDLTIDLK